MKKRLWKNSRLIKEEQGAVVVEATISLTAFMFVMVTIFTIVNICLAQAKIGIAICSTASDISKFSYLYELTNIQSMREGFASDAADAENTVNTLQSAMSKIQDLDFEGAAEDAGAAGNQITEMAENGELWSNILAFLKHEGTEYVADSTMEALCDVLVKSHLKTETMSGGDYLAFLGVVNAGGNTSGLDFSGSKFCSPYGDAGGEGDDIIVVVSYDVHVIELLGMDVKFHFQQCAPTKAWPAASGADAGGESEEAGD